MNKGLALYNYLTRLYEDVELRFGYLEDAKRAHMAMLYLSEMDDKEFEQALQEQWGKTTCGDWRSIKARN